MTTDSARRHAARALQAQLDIKYVRALQIVDADHAARARRLGSVEPDPTALLAPATRRAVTTAVNDWLARNLATVPMENAGLSVPFDWLSEAEIEAAGALALAAVDDETTVSVPRLLIARHDVFLMVSGWVGASSVARTRRRDVDVLVLEDHADGSEVLVGPLHVHGAFRVQLLPDGLGARVDAAVFSWRGFADRSPFGQLLRRPDSPRPA